MKKFLQNVLLRSLCILIFGLLLLIFSGDMSKWIVYASGGLFIVLGLLALLAYVRTKKVNRPSAIYPVVTMGCVLFGVVQLIIPDLFYSALRYLLAGSMFLLAVVQFFSLFLIHRGGVKMKLLTYLFPLIGIGVAAFVCFYKDFTDNDPAMLMILGGGFVVYSLFELWTVVLVKHAKTNLAEDEMLKRLEQ